MYADHNTYISFNQSLQLSNNQFQKMLDKFKTWVDIKNLTKQF